MPLTDIDTRPCPVSPTCHSSAPVPLEALDPDMTTPPPHP